MRDVRTTAMAWSLGVAVLMLAGKVGGYLLTGSTAILSDAVESVIHIVATGIAAFSLWFSHQSACEKHPYGHGKIAYFSAGFEGALILAAALFIFYSGLKAMILGWAPTRLHLGLVITGVLAVVNLVLGLFLVRVGKRRNALILVANGKHVLTDMWSSVGVLAGIGIVWFTGIGWLDPAVAMLVGVNILFGAFSLILRSFQGLLDEADPEKTERLLKCLQGFVDGGTVVGFHQLRHRQADDVMWVEVHFLVRQDISARRAHEKVTHIEEAIRAAFPRFQVHVTSHVEPAQHEDAHPEGHPGLGDPYA